MMSVGMMFLLSCIGCAFAVLALYLDSQARYHQSHRLLIASFLCWFIFFIFIVWFVVYVMPELMYGKDAILTEIQ